MVYQLHEQIIAMAKWQEVKYYEIVSGVQKICLQKQF